MFLFDDDDDDDDDDDARHAGLCWVMMLASASTVAASPARIDVITFGSLLKYPTWTLRLGVEA